MIQRMRQWQSVISLTFKKMPCLSSLRISSSSSSSSKEGAAFTRGTPPRPRRDVSTATTERTWEVRTNTAVEARKVVALRSCMLMSC